jgi:hypothetical protein
MMLSAVSTVICILWGQLSLEAAGGMVLPGSPESDTPALDLDLRLTTCVAPGWNAFISASFWKVGNFHPTDGIPDFTGIDPVFGYDVFEEYSDSHNGFQLGMARELGPVSLEMGGGTFSRKVMTYLSNYDVDARPGEETAKDSGLLASFAVGIPAGDHGILRLGTRTEGFEDWFMTVSAGIAITIPSPEGDLR